MQMSIACPDIRERILHMEVRSPLDLEREVGKRARQRHGGTALDDDEGEKVQGWLDVFGEWDPTLAFVLGEGAETITAFRWSDYFWVYIFAAAIGFALVLVVFAAIRERLAAADVPAPFRGTAIALMTAGIMSLAFMGFAGMARP